MPPQRARSEHVQDPSGAATRPHDGHRLPESRSSIMPFRVAIQTMTKPRPLVIVRLAVSSGLSVSIFLLVSPLGSLETCLRRWAPATAFLTKGIARRRLKGHSASDHDLSCGALESNPSYAGRANLTAILPPGLEADHEQLSRTVLRLPERDEIDAPVDEKLIVEHYSR